MPENHHKGTIVAISVSHQRGTKKKNVESAQLQEDHGIVGDAHAGPGNRQVSLLAFESIEKMREDGYDVRPGDFGENITVQGVGVSKLKPGTKIQIGKEVCLEVTLIGKTCHSPCEIYKQAGDCIMPKEGVFARVLRKGTIESNDEVEII